MAVWGCLWPVYGLFGASFKVCLRGYFIDAWGCLWCVQGAIWGQF